MSSLLQPLFNAAFDQPHAPRPGGIHAVHWDRWARLFRGDFDRRGITYDIITGNPRNYDVADRSHLRSRVQDFLFYTDREADREDIQNAIYEIQVFYGQRGVIPGWFSETEIDDAAKSHVLAMMYAWRESRMSVLSGVLSQRRGVDNNVPALTATPHAISSRHLSPSIRRQTGSPGVASTLAISTPSADGSITTPTTITSSSISSNRSMITGAESTRDISTTTRGSVRDCRDLN